MHERLVKPFFAWLALFLGVCLLLSGSVGMFSTEISPLDWSTQRDFYKSGRFRNAFSLIVSELVSAVSQSPYDADVPHITNDGGQHHRSSRLDSCGDILYYVRNDSPGSPVYTNGPFAFFTSYSPAAYSTGYHFVFSFNKGITSILLDGAEYHSYTMTSELLSILSGADLPPGDVSLFLAVGSYTEPSAFGSFLGSLYSSWRAAYILFTVSAAAAAVGFVLILLSLIYSRVRRVFVERIVAFLGRIYLEFKLIPALFLLWCAAALSVELLNRLYEPPLLFLLPACVILFILWYLFLDLVRHGRACFSHSLCACACRAAVRFSRARRDQTPLERRYLRRVWLFILWEGVFVFLAAFFLLLFLSWHHDRFANFLAFLCSAALCVFTLWLFMRSYHGLLRDLGVVRSIIESLRSGRYTEELPTLSEERDLFPLADGLIHLRDGISDAVNARVRSERMKAELITNVSHDLKTPLTSIISYSQLLDELQLDEPAGGYVRILREKSARLQRLTQDLFEVSRAQSGSLPVRMTRLDLKAHLEQTLAELSERIDASGLAFRVRLPDAPVHIDCDGERLYRVLENLVVNALTYAMPGTRVYIDLGADGVLSIRNVAAYEMTFSADEIAERFVRGDSSRTDGGTGLGLAIARSFTEAVGGRFALEIDGDVFRVTLSFPVQDAPLQHSTENEVTDPCTSAIESAR